MYVGHLDLLMPPATKRELTRSNELDWKVKDRFKSSSCRVTVVSIALAGLLPMNCCSGSVKSPLTDVTIDGNVEATL